MSDQPNFIAGAIERPGALTAAVGGKPSQHKRRLKELIDGKGGRREQQEASFYQNVLRPANQRSCK